MRTIKQNLPKSTGINIFNKKYWTYKDITVKIHELDSEQHSFD